MFVNCSPRCRTLPCHISGSVVRRFFRGQAEGPGGFLLLVEFLRERTVLEFEREHALLQVGYNRVQCVDKVFAVGDALFQLPVRGGGFGTHGQSVAHGAQSREDCRRGVSCFIDRPTNSGAPSGRAASRVRNDNPRR